jgi:tetratricopeptide (TPR) repeat protein
MSGDAESAASLCQTTAAVSQDMKQRAAALIRLAAIQKHRDKYEQGLSILRSVEEELEIQKPVDLGLLYWARYQRGVLLLAANRHTEAEKVLQEVVEQAGTDDHRTSARHQLGVIALLRGQYKQAEQLFRECLKEREPASFRRAFEYRRIAEACARDGRKPEAIRALKEGIRIARRSGFTRYQQEILKTATELGFAANLFSPESSHSGLDKGGLR